MFPEFKCIGPCIDAFMAMLFTSHRILQVRVESMPPGKDREIVYRLLLATANNWSTLSREGILDNVPLSAGFKKYGDRMLIMVANGLDSEHLADLHAWQLKWLLSAIDELTGIFTEEINAAAPCPV